jgi:hypothetical protein
MTTHIKILAWLHIVFGLFGAFLAVVILGGTMFGAAFAGSFKDSAIVGLAGGVAAIFFGAMAAFQLIAGWGLLKRMPWARILTIVLGVISLIRFPFGTALGVYTLWVLLSKEGASQFGVTSA